VTTGSQTSIALAWKGSRGPVFNTEKVDGGQKEKEGEKFPPAAEQKELKEEISVRSVGVKG